MRITDKMSAYAGIDENPEFVYAVSRDAVNEKDKAWRERYGYAEGSGVVSHADWSEVFDHAVSCRGSGRTGALVHVSDDKGNAVFIGAIGATNDKRIRLTG